MSILNQLSEQQKQAVLGANRGDLQALAGLFGINYHSLRRIRSELARECALAGEDSPDTPAIPTPLKAWDAQPLRLPIEQRWLYCADLHAPAYSETMVRRLVAVARTLKVKHLVIGGDLSDQATISKWPNVLPQHSLDYCQNATGELLSVLADTFEEIVVLPGNHDQRASKKMGTYVSFESFLWSCIKSRRFNADLVTTDHTFAYFGEESSSGKDAGIVCGHPTFFSSFGAKGISEVAMLQHRHVLGSHNHIIGQTFSKCGRYWAIDPGCMADESNTPYHQVGSGISKYGAWKQGFVLLRGTRPELMTDGWTDWSEYGAE